MGFWEAVQCSCCHTTDQRGFLDRLEGGGWVGGDETEREDMLDGEGRGGRRSEENLMKLAALISAGSNL